MLTIFFWFLLTTPPHALYLSTSKITLAENQNKLSIQIKIFSDDLQTALINHFNEKEISSTTTIGTKNLAQIKSYLKQHLLLNKANANNRWGMELLELTADYQESIYLLTAIYEDHSTNADKAEILEIQADYLMEVFPTQSNIIDLTYGEQRFFFRLKKNKTKEQISL